MRQTTSPPYDAPVPAASAVPPAPELAGAPRAPRLRVPRLDATLVTALVVATFLLLRAPAQAGDSEAARWLPGTATVLGAALVLAILSRSLPLLWPAAALGRLRDAIAAHPAGTVLVLGTASCALYASIALMVFGAAPRNLDEIAQLLQARIFAEGTLWRVAPAHPEFFSIYHVVDTGGRVYGQFPPGGPAMLALGELAGASWLVVPLCGAVAVMAWWATLRVVEQRSGIALGATLLFALSPFVAFLAGTSMNHLPALMWILVGVAALTRVTRGDRERPALSLLSGLAFGMAGTIRPADALAFALPAAVWLLARAARDRSRWRELAAAAVGVAVPLAIMGWVNASTTGAPLRFGYEVLWGKAHGIGFHQDPSGVMHTPARGLALVGGYLRSLQTHLFELPIPSLLPPLIALALARRATSVDRYLLGSAALLLALYVGYWFDGEYLGPRFVLPLVPLLALWTARLPSLVRERAGNGVLLRVVVYSYVAAIVIGLALLVPARARVYASASPEMRWDADSAAAAAGIRGAVVLVRESWGSQLLARMHALGISRPDASRLYRRTDTCLLDDRVTALESGGVAGARALAALVPLMADSARVVPSPFSPNTAERVLPGATYGSRCAARITQDRAGFTTLVLFALAQGNVYARDLHARNGLLLAQFPERPVYLLKPESEAPGAPLRFIAASRDSLMSARH